MASHAEGYDSDNSTITTTTSAASNSTMGVRQTFTKHHKKKMMSPTAEAAAPEGENSSHAAGAEGGDANLAFEALKSFVSLLNLAWITFKLTCHISFDILKKQADRWIEVIKSPDLWWSTTVDLVRWIGSFASQNRLFWIRSSATYAQVDAFWVRSWYWLRFNYFPISGISASRYLLAAKAHGIVLLITDADEIGEIRFQRLNAMLQQAEFGQLQKNLAIVWIRSVFNNNWFVKLGTPRVRLTCTELQTSAQDNSPIVNLRSHRLVVDADLANLRHIAKITSFLRAACRSGNLTILNAVWSVGVDDFSQMTSSADLQANYLGQAALTRNVSDLFKSGIGMACSYKKIDQDEKLPILTNSLQAPHALRPSEHFELDLYMQNLRLKGMNMMLSNSEEVKDVAPSQAQPKSNPSSPVAESKDAPSQPSASSPVQATSPSSVKQSTSSQTTRRVNLKGGNSSKTIVSEKKSSQGDFIKQSSLDADQGAGKIHPLHFQSGPRRLSVGSSGSKKASGGFSSALDELLSS
eukprot:TRINITY_DN11010_c0_g1_i1.p1 TRINITY_DN11010_c0_g1~~TRINITY_DN11010_c0_g1_i1.p1  ORF type:complete len:523 (+),score=141.01 TRINITY_DN11010_c0_g1_i1:114-1682(+)